jgi:hypothetical protein
MNPNNRHENISRDIITKILLENGDYFFLLLLLVTPISLLFGYVQIVHFIEQIVNILRTTKRMCESKNTQKKKMRPDKINSKMNDISIVLSTWLHHPL